MNPPTKGATADDRLELSSAALGLGRARSRSAGHGGYRRRPFLGPLNWRLSWIAGPAFAAGHFHGREKRDYESSVPTSPGELLFLELVAGQYERLLANGCCLHGADDP